MAADAKSVSNSIKQSLTTLFDEIADSIRIKEKSHDPIAAEDFPSRIAAIETEEESETSTYVNYVVQEVPFDAVLPTFTFTQNQWYFYDGARFSEYAQKPSNDISLVARGTFYVLFATTATANSYQIYLICSDDTIIEDITFSGQTPSVLSLSQAQLRYQVYEYSLTDVSIEMTGKLLNTVLDEELTIPNDDPVNSITSKILNVNSVGENENLNTILDSILL